MKRSAWKVKLCSVLHIFLQNVLFSYLYIYAENFA